MNSKITKCLVFFFCVCWEQQVDWFGKNKIKESKKIFFYGIRKKNTD